MLRLIKEYFDFKIIQDECRKIGVNFITAGFVGLFFTNASNLKFSLHFSVLTVIAMGLFILFCGVFRRKV